MQIKFQVDRRAAVKRGVNAVSQVVTLDVDPAALTQTERDLIAERITQAGEVCGKNEKGAYQIGNYVYDSVADLEKGSVYREKTSAPQLVTATGIEVADLVVAIVAEDAAVKAKADNDRRAKEAEIEKRRIETQAVLDARKTRSYSEGLYVWRNKQTDRIESGNTPNGMKPSVFVQLNQVRPDWPYNSDEVVVARGAEWQAELDASNARNRKAAIEQLTIDLDKESAKIAEAEAKHKAGVAELREWAKGHGSDLLTARIEGEFEWVGLAEREWSSQQVVGLGKPVEDPDETQETEIEERTTPTLPEIEKLKNVRSLIDTAHSEAELVWCVYTCGVEDEYGATSDTETVKRAEVKVTVTCPTGRDVEYFYGV